MENRIGRGSIFSNRIDISKPGGGVGSRPLRRDLSPRTPEVQNSSEAGKERPDTSQETQKDPVLEVRTEKWGSTEIRIATVLPRLTRSHKEPWSIPKAVYPESDYLKQTNPTVETSMDVGLGEVVSDVPMGQGKEYRPQLLQRAVGLST